MEMSEVLKFDKSHVGTTKLSEDIRIGATKHPQTTRGVFTDGRRTCALGAAAVARGWDGDSRVDVSGTYLRDVPDRIWYEIANMNDGGRYTREQIADWLEAQGL